VKFALEGLNMMEVKSETVVKVNVGLTFDELVDAVSHLTLKNKARLHEILYEQIEQEEEEVMMQNPEVRARMEQARKDYEAGDYVTWEEYKAERAEMDKQTDEDK